MDFYKTTFDAVFEASRFYEKSEPSNSSLADFIGLARFVLLLSPEYESFVSDFEAEQGLNRAEALACIEAISNGVYGKQKEKGSAGEARICEILNKKGVEYEREKRFDTLRHVGELRFDFFIRSRNLAIEFNGKQHYEAVGRFGGDEAFGLIKMRDEVKRRWCIENKIRLVEIRHDDDLLKAIDGALNGI